MTREKLLDVIARSGKSGEQITAEVSCLKKEYGISEKKYLEMEYYLLPEEELIRTADRLRRFKRYVRKVCDATGWDAKEAKTRIREARARFGISTKTYWDEGYYLYDGEEQEVFHETLNNAGKESAENTVRKDWISLICRESGWSEEKAREEVSNARKDFGASPSLFYKMRLFEFSETGRAVELLKRDRRLLRLRRRYEIIESLCGKTKEDIRNDLEYLSDTDASFYRYFADGLYMFSLPEELDKAQKFLDIADRRQALSESLKDRIRLTEQGKCTTVELNEDIEQYTHLKALTLSKARRLEHWDKIRDVLDDDMSLFDPITLDMEVMTVLFGFTGTEYVIYHFWEKELKERLTFLSNEQKSEFLRSINTEEAKQVFDNKFTSYQVLKPYYGREAVLINHENGYKEFRDFALRHRTFVKKDNYDAMGRGVMKIDTTGRTPLKDIFDDLSAEKKSFLLEELIEADEEITALNPDSVNTVRIVTSLTGKTVSIEDCFMKIGRAGSFVDNGGAGGIFVHVNKETGVFDSTGIDEHGFRYDNHPDHGYRFKGIELPGWESALETAKKAAMAVDGARYIGWDLTYTKDKRWIIVEGNAATQFVAQQGTTDKGIRDRFIQLEDL